MGYGLCKLAKKSESHKKMVKSEPFAVVGKKWLFDLPDVHFAQSKEARLTDIRYQIIDFDRAPRRNYVKVKELLNVYGGRC